MSRQSYLFVPVLLCLFGGSAKAMDPDLAQFLYAKQQQISILSESLTNKIPHSIWRFYDAAGIEDWDSVSRIFGEISTASQRYVKATNDDAMTPALATAIWPPISESDGACEQADRTHRVAGGDPHRREPG